MGEGGLLNKTCLVSCDLVPSGSKGFMSGLVAVFEVYSCAATAVVSCVVLETPSSREINDAIQHLTQTVCMHLECCCFNNLQASPTSAM